MARVASVSRFRPEFDSFLHAPIGDDEDGTLSVLSALARQDVDPWQEAADLARMPRDAAVRKLASLIAALPECTSALQDSRTTATHLIALLPRLPGFEIRTPDPSRGSVTAITNLQPYFVYVMVFFLAVALGSQLFSADDRPTAHVASIHGRADGLLVPVAPLGHHGP